METGKISELNERYCGFINRAGSGGRLFFHADDLVGSSFTDLRRGDRVSFSVTESRKGPYAVHVTLV
jgi:CspA family cold shock protein